MKTVLITGSMGLAGSVCVKRFAREVYNIGGGRHSTGSRLEEIHQGRPAS
jgi:NAD(P)-dependent dehydrogenase (short-subunit alcohol dehydrogenase family)